MTMDLHADQIQDFWKPVDHLFDYLSTLCKSLGLDNLTIASPDMGGSKEPTPILNFRIRCSNLLQTKKRLT
jgi:phosphoribosylpyrophosphate synthetase